MALTRDFGSSIWSTIEPYTGLVKRCPSQSQKGGWCIKIVTGASTQLGNGEWHPARSMLSRAYLNALSSPFRAMPGPGAV
ncbi:hypothetical protein N7462_004366 [Penicillium macrosclerotiorum]|uniref:uncharacterized protein n=1 Tax=Penicillium macrosclerotiorum TaxID=303699 RepID=UPI002547E985|nr:uncharacterized protein N7462_004366 [Penicillium macrosclerotiorum]KAJ5689974.1 hypothetical protein N7462_004366 [Penicillium macrosclerotiorum]